MTPRERFLAAVAGRPVDRPPYWLYWPPWDTAWKAWKHGGLPEEFGDFKKARASFHPDALPREVPVNLGPCPRMKRAVIEETGEFVVYVDGWGIKRRDFKNRESMSEFLRHPVRGREEWESFRAEKLDPFAEGRLGKGWREQCAEWTARGFPLQLGCYPESGIFGGFRWLMGDEEGLMAFCTMPDLVHDIMDHLTAIHCAVFEKVAREFPVDVIHLWEDICFKNGPFISPDHWKEFIAPCYRRIKALADRYGIPVISVDTDGNAEKLLPLMIECGVNLIYPLEVTAGMDVNRLQEKFPGLAMMGGIDKRALAQGQGAIDRELERVRPAVKRGRYVPDLDHLVPDNVSWENYAYYARRLKELVGKID